MRYVIIDKNTKVVANIVDYDAPPSDPPPGFDDNFTAVQNDVAGVGWAVVGGVPVPPPPTPIDARTLARFNYQTLIDRRADRLEKAGDTLGAIQLRLGGS